MIVQLIVEPLIFRSVAMCGSAMFTAVMSRMTISWATSSTGEASDAGAGRCRAVGRVPIACVRVLRLVMHDLTPSKLDATV